MFTCRRSARRCREAPVADIRGHCDTGQEPEEPGGVEWSRAGSEGARLTAEGLES